MMDIILSNITIEDNVYKLFSEGDRTNYIQTSSKQLLSFLQCNGLNDKD